MSGSSSIGFVCESGRSIRMLAICVCLAVTMFAGSSTAYAQLRNGRTQRSLYKQDRAVRQSQSQPTSRAAVVRASFDEPMSILEADGDYDVMTASCEGCDSGCDSCGDEQFFDQGIGCGAQGCDGLGCDTCCGGYSSIAPTCTSACPPGCGPLLALWYRLSVRAEVPLYWRRDQGPPALVTTADAGTGADLAGQLGQSTTDTLLGDGTLTDEATAGFRLTLGTWLGGGKRYGLLLRAWTAGDQDDTYNFDSSRFPILARPFFNTTLDGAPEQDAQLVAFPNESVGSINVAITSSVSGVEFSLRRLLYMDRFTRIDWLYGYQHVGIDEGLTISSNTTVTGNVPGLQGTSIAVTDSFQTENDFNGVSYGLMSTREMACWKMETMLRLGAGNLRRSVNIAGTTTTTSAGAVNTVSQGLLARNTNRQAFVDDTFIVIPELGINFAYRFRPGVDFNLGYNYMVIPKVAQAAQQIDNDLAVNLSDPLVGSLDPQLDFVERRYWLHSLGLGLQVRY